MSPKEYLTSLSAVLVVFCSVAIGAFIRKRNWLTEAADGSLLRVTFNVLLPALIFHSILRNAALKQFGNILLAPIAGFVTVALGFGVAFAVGKYAGKYFGLAGKSAVCAFALCLGIYNFNYPPLALAKSHFGSDTVGVMLVHNVGIEIFLSTFVLMFLGVTGVSRGWRKIINAPLIAIVLALTINFFDFDRSVPRFVWWTTDLLAQCAIPLGLILIGATLVDYWHDFKAASGWRLMLASCVVRLGVLPSLFLLAARFLPVSVELKQVLVLQAAMPAAVFPIIILVKHYGGDMATAMRVTVSTFVVSLATMPFWMYWGIKFARLG